MRDKILAAAVFALLVAGVAMTRAADYDLGVVHDVIVGNDIKVMRNAQVNGTLTTTGAVTQTGAATFNGAVSLGDASGDAITVTGTMTSTPLITATGGFLVPTKFTVSAAGNVDAAMIILAPPAAQTIAEGATIAADACGGIKTITAAGGVTTSTTNTFTAPAAANTGCCMDVVNVGAQTITLDANTNFISAAAGNVAMTQLDSLRVCSNGTAWYQISALLSLN